MAKRTANLQLYAWDLRTDKWKHAELAANWDQIDAKIWTAKNQIEILSAIPVSGNYAGRLIMLSATSGGFAAWTVIRYDGSAWAAVGQIEVHSALPALGNFAGRFVLCTTEVERSPAWTLFVYTGTVWRDLSTIGIKNNGTLVGERRRINFEDGEGIAVDLNRDTENNRLDVRFASSAQSSIVVRKDGNTVGERKRLNFADAQHVTITAVDVPISNRVDLTYAATVLQPVGKVPILLGHASYNPGSVTTKTLDYVPPAAQPSQADQAYQNQLNWSHRFMIGHTYVWNEQGELISATDNIPDIGGNFWNDLDERSNSASMLRMRGWQPMGEGLNQHFTPTPPAQATKPLASPVSTPWKTIDGSLSITFTVPDSGGVIIHFCGMPNIEATSPRLKVYTPQRRPSGYTVHTATGDKSFNSAADAGNYINSISGGTNISSATATDIYNQYNANAFNAPFGPSVPVGTLAAGEGPARYTTGPDGSVTVSFEGRQPLGTGMQTIAEYSDLSDAQIQWAVMDDDAVVPGSAVSADNTGTTGKGNITRTVTTSVITGLEPGSSHTWRWVWRVFNPYERATVKGYMYAGSTIGPTTLEIWSLP